MGQPDWALLTEEEAGLREPSWFEVCIRFINPYWKKFTVWFIPKEYLVRHKILYGLYTEYKSAIGLNIIQEGNTVEVDEDRLRDNYGLTINDIRHYYRGLLSNQEMTITSLKPLKFAISSQGIIAVTGEHHLQDGKKEFWERWYTPIKVFAALATICAALLAISTLRDHKLNILEERVNKLQIEQQQLEKNQK